MKSLFNLFKKKRGDAQSAVLPVEENKPVSGMNLLEAIAANQGKPHAPNPFAPSGEEGPSDEADKSLHR
ncbi:hypothetical protein [Parachitinimonas caeni]|uniref:Signal recognition particle-docking protein FtsY n=1 Tax=Parachitinimonas caeni TaxID=3031301 RepID=A0ABT7DW45_9NEIS|nr:hypothetical protein [Parachitinimonas caeni]MDK2122877.1 hypothetical protein [Parachitinimonas caeni]